MYKVSFGKLSTTSLVLFTSKYTAAKCLPFRPLPSPPKMKWLVPDSLMLVISDVFLCGSYSKSYVTFMTCMKTAIVGCYSKLPEETTEILVEAAMGLVKAQSFYCNDTALNINLTAVPDEVKNAVSCKEAYFGEGATCANDFRKNFATNRMNTDLCG